MFPSSRYILATTGSSKDPGVIAPRSSKNARAPNALKILYPRASLSASAVARDGNAYALLAPSGGKVFVSRLRGSMNGYQADHEAPKRVLKVGRSFVRGDVGFRGLGAAGEAGEAGEALVVAYVVNPRSRMGFFAEVAAFGF